MSEIDLLVIGGDLAGASAAYEIVARHPVILREREAFCSYHSTGRPAASFTENYGKPGDPLHGTGRAWFCRAQHVRAVAYCIPERPPSSGKTSLGPWPRCSR